MNKKLWLILVLAAVLRLLWLNQLPAEMWGDVIQGYEFAQRVLAGNFYWRYEFGGDGPLFSYLVTLLSLPFGLSFWTMKLATAVVGLLLVLVVYYLGKEYVSEEVGLLAAFLMAISKWSLIFSRMAKPHLLAALFAALTFLFLLKLLKTGRWWWALLLGGSLGLGMYTQAAFWGVPFAVMAVLLLVSPQEERWQSKAGFFKKTAVIFLPTFVLLLPFFSDFFQRQAYFLGGFSFFGEKMAGFNLLAFGINLLKNLTMFHFRGDGTFRSNPPGQPQLDFLSGIFFILGIFALKKRRLEFWLPFLLLQAPSLLDINNPASTPNAGRTIGLIPWVYILIAMGTVKSFNYFKQSIKNIIITKKINSFIQHAAVLQINVFYYGILLSLVFLLNFKQVFQDYASGLPNHNTPFGKIIASEIDKLPEETEVFVLGCCWGEWGQPEPGGIKYALKKKRQIKFLGADDNPEVFSCEKFKIEHTAALPVLYFVVNPNLEEQKEKVRACFPQGREKEIWKNDWRIATAYEIGL